MLCCYAIIVRFFLFKLCSTYVSRDISNSDLTLFKKFTLYCTKPFITLKLINIFQFCKMGGVDI